MKRMLCVIFLALFMPFAFSGEPIDINRATPAELVAIKGIGPSKAQSIVSYREAHGPYQTVEDLTKVKGIKSGVLEMIRSQVRVGNSEPFSSRRASQRQSSSGSNP